MSSGWGTSSGFGGASAFGNNNQQNSSGLFGSTNNSTAFGQKPALSLNPPQANSGGLFGNTSGSSFGQQPQNTNTGGLFGNSGANNTANTANTSGGLFGATNNTANTGSTGLFGSTANQASNTGNASGLFGNLASSGGLFGKPAGTAAPTTGGLFGNMATANKPAGLFGGSTTTPAAGMVGTLGTSGTSGGLFGSKPATGGLFGNSASNTQTGGLFAKPAAPAASGGLFGNSGTATQSGGLFGNSNTGTSGGLFGNSASGLNRPATGILGQQNTSVLNNGTATTASNANPYGSGPTLSTINQPGFVMPQSITGSLFARPQQKRSHSRSAVSRSKQEQQNSSLFSKLALTFNIFRATTDSSNDSSISRLKGIFSQQNFVKDEPIATKSKFSVSKTRTKPLLFALPLETHGADIKRLVIKSKPLKFHLINADKVFSARKRRVITLALNAAHQQSLTDDEVSDIEDDVIDKQERNVAQPVITKPFAPITNEDTTLVPDEDPDGYWTTPTIRDLNKYSEEELTHVENFIIGRKDVGQIAYNYPVDLSTLFLRCEEEGVTVQSELFGKIVKMEGSIVQVYDVDGESLTKPPIGFELNVPATITLRAPPRKNISKQDHIRRLQNLTGMEFVTFDPLTDNWTFKVKHFSVWGLLDDSEEEHDNAEMTRLRVLKKEQDRHEGEASAMYSRIYESEEYKQELKRQKIGGSTKGVPGGWDYGSISQTEGALELKQKLVAEEINRQINIYKQDKSVDALAANASDITIESDAEDVRSPNSLALDAPIYADEVRSYDYLKQIVSGLPPNTDFDELVDEKAYEPDIEDEAVFDKFSQRQSLATSKDWLLQLELANGIDSALTPYLTIPRKQTSSLKAVNDILFSDFDKSSVVSNQISTPIKELKRPLSITNFEAHGAVTSVPKLVQHLLLKVSVESRSDGFPRSSLHKSLNFKETTSMLKADSSLAILELASILFDDIDLSSLGKYQKIDLSNGELVRRLQHLTRREQFAKWLKSNKKDQLSKRVSDDPLARIEHLVLQGDLTAAIELAVSSHNSHLSALLTLLDSNEAVVKDVASDQLEEWELTNALQFIPRPVISIYKILAGRFDEVSLGLSFEASVGLHLFYGDSSQKFEDIFKAVSQKETDEFLELIRIYTAVKLEGFSPAVEVIKTSELSEQTKWLIFSVLALKYGEEHSLASADKISEQFGSLLASAGLWKESLFIYSFITDDKKVAELVRSVVIREVAHVKSETADEEQFVVKVLGVPRSLVYEAVAIDKAQQKDFWGQGRALVEAELWLEAHECIQKHLGPDAVIDNDYELEQDLETLIGRFPDNGSIIPSWDQGAGLYARYFEVTRAVENQGVVSAEDVGVVLDNLALLPDYNLFTVKVAIKIMSKKIGDIALDNKETVLDMRKKIMGLKLGENELSYFDNRLTALGF